METKKDVKKRQRSENWVEEDKQLLVELVRERVQIIENKNTETNTNSKKVAAWVDLQSSFNGMCKGGPRTIPQLKSQWGMIKVMQRKVKADERRYMLKTGGGPPPPAKGHTDDDDADDIATWLPHEFVIDINEFDSDQINQIQYKNEKSEKNEKKVDEIINNTIEVQEGAVIIADGPSDNVIPEVASCAAKRPAAAASSQTPSKKSRKDNVEKAMNAAANIAVTEIECRKEYHHAQMENEK